MNPTTIFNSFENQQIVIVGDVMLDRYWMGQVSRISPEAPVPVVLFQKSEDRLGGAANVALNVKALGGTPILCSIIGKDEGAGIFRKLLPEAGISATGLIESPDRKTTIKTRILGNNQQMLRIDQEDTHDINRAEEDLLLQKLEEILKEGHCKVLVFQDYNKGVLTPHLIEETLKITKKYKVLTAVDPKKANFFAYQGVDLFKPNLKEIRDSVPFKVSTDEGSLHSTVIFLQEKINNRLTMITLSEKGLYLEGETDGKIFPTKSRNIADVSGAGDTVISIAALSLATGLDLQTMAVLCNLAGGQVCEFPGVVPVRLDILINEYQQWLLQTKST